MCGPLAAKLASPKLCVCTWRDATVTVTVFAKQQASDIFSPVYIYGACGFGFLDVVDCNRVYVSVSASVSSPLTPVHYNGQPVECSWTVDGGRPTYHLSLHRHK